MRLTEDKKFKTVKEAKREVTFIYFQAYESDTKTLSYTIRLSVTVKTLFYNKMECYN